jgi:uncharacterized membrane protein
MKSHFSPEDQQKIVEAIKIAELNTSGEIKVHIESHCKYDVIDRAADVFNKLGMANTTLRNGVLIYLAITDHRFAIIGDKGINEKVPDHFWADTRDTMQKKFKEQRFTDGLVEGIIKAGEQLKSHFPYSKSDTNELNDQISFG